MAWLWSFLYVYPLIVLATIVCGSASVIAVLFDKSGSSAMRIARFWARLLLAIARVRVKVEGIEKLQRHTPYIFVANHLSYMDTPAVLGRIPLEFRFMAKQALFKIPFMGTHLAQAGHIPVPIDDPRASIRALTQAAHTIREHGSSVLIFPEGGRSETGILQPFKDGAAYLAIKAGVPVVPIVLIGTRKIMPMHSRVIRPGRVMLRIGDPIPTTGLTTRNRGAVTESARQQIVKMLEG
jgi:1-acyl-sn-glycerol-3-phosphate acyltransferase